VSDLYRAHYDLAKWYVSYRRNIRLSGILYLHRISDNRIAKSAVRNLDALKAMCGDEALRNVVFATTMWDEVPPRVALRREQELHKLFWRPMLDTGARAMRFVGSFDSAWEIIDAILRQAPSPHLHLQMEQVDQRIPLRETRVAIPLQNTQHDAQPSIKKKIRRLFRKVSSLKEL
jgi:hypothetical protein